MKFLLSRGQQIKTMSKLLRVCKERGYIVPSRTEAENEDHTKGATVLDPIRGLHRNPVNVLDFKSLYPSIMIAYNICYSTKCSLAWARGNLAPGSYNVPPIPGVRYCFVKPHIIKGILCQMEEFFLSARSAAKNDMFAEKDPVKKAVLDGRQLALKIVCNSVYGFVKANMVCDKDLMEAVTAWGREMIDVTKELVEREYPGAVVTYGDTDSVMVDFGPIPLAESIGLGVEASAKCTAKFVPPNELEYEKTYWPFLLMGKKRYAGYKYEGLKKAPVLASSGLENVRRDNCLLVASTITTVLEMILIGNDERLAIEYVHQLLRTLLNGDMDLSQLVISKSLSKTFEHYEKSGSKQPHVEVAKKIQARSAITGEDAPHTGDRVKYVVVADTTTKKTGEKSEDPLFVLRNRLPIDYDYYIHKQLRNPLCKIFTPILAPDKKSEKKQKVDEEGSQWADIIKYEKPEEKTFKHQKGGKNKGARINITDREWRKLTAYKVLFEGDHMRKVTQTVNTGKSTPGTLLSFARVLPKCLSCNTMLRDRNLQKQNLCAECEPQRQVLIHEHRRSEQVIQNRIQEVWDICRICAGMPNAETGDVPCDNKDCNLFFHRQKILMDMEDLGKKLSKLGV